MRKEEFTNDTIAAVSTPLGEGGIGIIRLSGPNSLSIADKIFKSKNGKKPSSLPTYTTHYGHIVRKGKRIEEVILTVMRAPRSYTREDIVEINCHGGIVPLKQVLDLVLEDGARMASPGEFTKRAFLNGRIDLSQAEAVVDLIRAKTEEASQVALAQLEGKLSEEVKKIREEIISLLAIVEAAIDFPEEDIERLSGKEMLKRTRKISQGLERLLSTAEKGKVLREGINTVIAGRPNVGKSSLMNAFLREKRVIVTPVPGTTRDTIEEIVNIEGIPLKVIDTAGIRKVRSVVEKAGVERSRLYLERADLVLLILDGSENLAREDRELIKKAKDRDLIVVINKIDLPQKIGLEKLKKLLPGKRIIKISALYGNGLSSLEKYIGRMLWKGKISSPQTVMVTRARHKEALLGAQESIKRVLESLKSKMSEEFLALDLKAALDNLGEIVGETTTEDILDKIFSEFCIGK
jgi:tRNA modification GTPase